MAPDSSPGTVLHVAQSFFERSETFLYNQIAGLKRWRSVLVCAEKYNESEFPLAGVPIHAFPIPNNSWMRLYDRLARRCGFPATWDRDHRLMRRLQAGLRQLVNDTRPPVVAHAHFGVTGVMTVDVCQNAGIPLVTSFYGYDSAPRGSALARDWFYPHYGKLFGRCRFVLVEGPGIAQRLQKDWGCPREKIRLLRIAVPVAAIKFQPRAPSGNRPVQLLFCGRFVEKKGLLVLIRALEKLKRQKRAFHCRVIGDGKQRDEVEQLIGQLGLHDDMTLLGLQPRARFWEELASCDLLVAPSRTAANGDTEGGAPTVLLEAQAAGVPVVTTDHADIPTVVVPGGSAFLAREGDPGSLAAALEDACAQQARWPEMGATGRRFVSENHDVPVVCSRLESIYDEAISGP
jgi:colanic acid/amylovoran biosynthesis glycosyltransferase